MILKTLINLKYLKIEAFKTIAENRLSTTGFSHSHLKGLYFPPVQADGFGIFLLGGRRVLSYYYGF